MSLVINTNMMAMNAARNLGVVYGRLAVSTQRLSSGLRINSAADDAAGLAVRELQRADVAVLNQGIRNAGDAISMIQTAEGALQVVDEKLIRMKELAEQASTGTYTDDQRQIMQDEYNEMSKEITRIANATDFNSQKLLDGSMSGEGMKIHFGTGNDSAEDYYYISVASMTAETLGVAIGGVSQAAVDAQDAVVAQAEVAAQASAASRASLAALIASTTVASRAERSSIAAVAAAATQASVASQAEVAAQDAVASQASMASRAAIGTNGSVASQAAVDSQAAIVISQAAVASQAAVTSHASVASQASVAASVAAGSVASVAGIASQAAVASQAAYTITQAAVASQAEVAASGMLLNTQHAAQEALTGIDVAISTKDTTRANLGAMQNRLENTITNLTIQAENVQAAESRISDVDVAAEMTEFTRNSILVQAATAMLAQANSLPQLALSLIGG